MKKSWTDTSGVCSVQLLFGMLMYGMTHSIVVAFALVGLFSFFVVLTERSERLRAIDLTATFAALCISAGMGTAIFVNSVAEFSAWIIFEIVIFVLVTFILFVAVFVVIFFEVDTEIEECLPDSWWVLVPVRIPAGIGTVIGGMILLYRQWQRFRETAGWV